MTKAQFLAVNPDGFPADLLPPGAAGQLSAKFQGTGQDLTFHLDAVEASATPIEWSLYKEGMRPSSITTEEWNLLWPTLQSRLGTTWADYLARLGQNAERLRRRGAANICVSELLSLEIRAAQGEPTSAIAGTLYHTDTNKALGGVTVIARSRSAPLVRVAQSDLLSGHFVLENLPAGSYDLVVEGYYFDNPTPITVVEGQDTLLSTLRVHPVLLEEVVEEAPPEEADLHPTLVRDDQGRVHLVWQRGGSLWYAQYANAGWQFSQPITGTSGVDPHLAFDPQLIDGTTPGLALVWQEGHGNGAVIRNLLGQIESDGSLVWSTPISLTQDAFGDSHPVVATASDGQSLITLWLQQNWDIADDNDLYYQVAAVPSKATLRFYPKYTPDYAEAGLPAFFLVDSIQLPKGGLGQGWCIGVEFAEGTTLPIPIIGGRYGFEIEGEGCFVESGAPQCKADLSGDLSAEIKLSKLLSAVHGSANIEGAMLTDTESCAYALDEVTVGLNVGATKSFFDVEIDTIRVFGIKRVELEADVGITGNFGGSLTWKTGNFPGLPDSGKVNGTLGAFLEGEIDVFDKFEVEVRGDGYVTVGYEKSAGTVGGWDFHAYCLDVRATVEAKFDFTYLKQWGKCDAALFMATLRDGERQASQQTLFSYTTQNEEDVPVTELLIISLNPDFAGTGSIYEGSPVLSNTITSDLTDDYRVAIAKNQGQQLWAAWTKDAADSATGLGSAVVVSSLTDQGWGDPMEVSPATNFNKQTTLVFDQSDNPMLVWASAPATVTTSSPITDVIQAMAATEIVYAQYLNGAWTSPQPVATLPGSDTNPQIAISPAGQIFVAWLNESDTGTTLYTSFWNGTAWSAPELRAFSVHIGSVATAFSQDEPIVLWTQDVDGAEATEDDSALHYSVREGEVWSTPARIAQPASAFTRMFDYPRSRNSIQNLQALGILPAPPEDCCTCPEGEDCDKPEPPEPPSEPVDEDESQSVEAHDPNEKIAPLGYGDMHILPPTNDALQYSIYFENVITATAPAQEVFVTDKLDKDLDWASVRFEGVAFGTISEAIVDEGSGQFHTRLSVPDYRAQVNKEWWVDVTGSVDPSTGVILWVFRTLDPDTGTLPEDALAGFLPPNDDNGRGEGHVTFSINYKEDIPLGTRITNLAEIVFDINKPIVTNEVFNTIDDIPGNNEIYLPQVVK